MRQVIHVFLGLSFFALAFIKGDFLSLIDTFKTKDLPLATVQRQYVDIATLGYRAAWDRIIIIWTLQEGEALAGVSNSDEIFRIFFNAAKLRPRAHHLYLYGCGSTGFKSKNFKECIDILNIGIEVFPDSWSMYTFLGLSYFLDRDDKNAALAFKEASTKPGAPSYLNGIYTKFLETGILDAKDAQDTLNQALNDSSLSRLRERLLKKEETR